MYKGLRMGGGAGKEVKCYMYTVHEISLTCVQFNKHSIECLTNKNTKAPVCHRGKIFHCLMHQTQDWSGGKRPCLREINAHNFTCQNKNRKQQKKRKFVLYLALGREKREKNHHKMVTVCNRSWFKPVLNWVNVCSPEHTSDTSTNYDLFLNWTFSSPNIVWTVQTLLHSQLACNEMQASARTCGRRAADSMIENVG